MQKSNIKKALYALMVAAASVSFFTGIFQRDPLIASVQVAGGVVGTMAMLILAELLNILDAIKQNGSGRE
jgi:hypothetical protein